ncbi:MAG: hypothetical protein IJT94_02235, partial [Oscillibacter sp.]|nr:hypothetical protein [Oscillibacter sp.]
VLIGVGQTGIRCIRAIKTRVYDRLRPEDEEGPSYPHIRFLGIDSGGDGGLLPDPEDETAGKDGLLPLNEDEFFSIESSRVLGIAKNPASLRAREDLSWLESEDIEILLPAGGGARQADRLRMLDRAEEYMNAVRLALRRARVGLEEPLVNVTIFSALCGDAGSGCFLDVCYLTRRVLSQVDDALLMGCFFLPDVSAARLDGEGDWLLNAVKANGYAAMQELDFCMNLPRNGGAFRQTYQGGIEIAWDRPPVDLCTLAGTLSDGPDAYGRALDAVADSILTLLTDSGEEESYLTTLAQEAAERVDERHEIGACASYCAIGAASACVPVREINACLASALFGRFFQLQTNTPTRKEVEELAVSALSRTAHDVKDLYESLLREVLAGISGEYEPFTGSWESVWGDGEAAFSSHYLNQTVQKIYRIRSNASALMDPEGKNSLIRRVHRVMRPIVSDLERGPIYACRILSTSEIHNLSGLVDGLITENAERMNAEAEQREQLQKDFENARSVFIRYGQRRRRPAGEKRFKAYDEALKLHQQNRVVMEAYQRLDAALILLKEQLSGSVERYYGTLARVMENLMETFSQNQAVLNDGTYHSSGGAAFPLLSVEEIRTAVEGEMERAHIPNMLDALMETFLRNEDLWLDEDEEKIARLVSGFLIQTAFRDFTSRTVAGFLREKYRVRYGGRLAGAALHRAIYSDCLEELADSARPLFRFNSDIWRQEQSETICLLSLPAGSSSIRSASEYLPGGVWTMVESAQTDRISAVCVAAGVPLAAWAACREYERACRGVNTPGRYSYEGKPVKGMRYNDWRALPSVLPLSALREEDLSPARAEALREVKSLYERARNLGVLDDAGYLCLPDKTALEKLQRAYDACMLIVSDGIDAGSLRSLESAINTLSQSLALTMVRTNLRLPSGGEHLQVRDRLRVLEDFFAVCSALHG